MTEGIRIVRPHLDLGEDDDYHDWVYAPDSPRRIDVATDRLMRLRPNDPFRNTMQWVCNNTSCAGLAYVRYEAVASLIGAVPDA